MFLIHASIFLSNISMSCPTFCGYNRLHSACHSFRPCKSHDYLQMRSNEQHSKPQTYITIYHSCKPRCNPNEKIQVWTCCLLVPRKLAKVTQGARACQNVEAPQQLPPNSKNISGMIGLHAVAQRVTSANVCRSNSLSYGMQANHCRPRLDSPGRGSLQDHLTAVRTWTGIKLLKFLHL